MSKKEKKWKESIMKIHVTSKGRITIPAALRQKYGIKAGARIIITETDDGITLRPVTRLDIAKLKGALKGSGALEFLIEERAKDKARQK